MENKHKDAHIAILVRNRRSLAHAGVKGQKWGVRRFQNKDGSLTNLGKIHYGVGDSRKLKEDDANLGSYAEGSTAAIKRITAKSAGNPESNARTGGTDKSDLKISDPKIKVADAAKSAKSAPATTPKVEPKKGGETPKAEPKKGGETPKAEPKKGSDTQKTESKKSNDQTTTNKSAEEQAKAERERFDTEIKQMGAASNAMKKSSELAGAAKTSLDNSIRNTPKIKLDLSNMTDAELRKAIDRQRLEDQYNEYFAPSGVSKGKLTVSKMLGGLTTGLAIGGSAVSLAIAIRQLISK